MSCDLAPCRGELRSRGALVDKFERTVQKSTGRDMM